MTAWLVCIVLAALFGAEIGWFTGLRGWRCHLVMATFIAYGIARAAV